MATNIIQIVLQAVDKGVKSVLSGVANGFDQVNKASQTYRNTLQTLTGNADSLRSTMGSLIATIGGASLFAMAGRQAIQFNSTVEQSQIGIAALLRTFSEADGKTMGMNESMQVAADIQKRLQIEGLKTTATYEQLLVALQEGLGPAMKAGFNPDQVVKFTSLMTQAAAALSVPMDQLGQEIRSILDGTIDANSRVAKALGLTNEKIKQMADQGKLFDFLSVKLQAFGAAGDAMGKTFSGAWSNLVDAVGMAIGTSLKSSFDATTAFLLRLKDAIVTVDEAAGTFSFSQKIVAALEKVDRAISNILNKFSTDELAEMIASFIEMMGEIATAVIRFIAVLSQLWQMLGPFAPAVAMIVTNFMLWGVAFKAVLGLPIALVSQIIALRNALISLQATEFIPWLGKMNASMPVAATSFGLLQAAVAGLGSYLVGLKIGDWLYKMTDPAERSLAELQDKVEATERSLRQFASFNPADKNDLFAKSKADLEKYKQDLEGAYRQQVALVQSLTIQSRDRGFFGGLSDEAKKAQVDLGAAKERLKTLGTAMDEYGEVAKIVNGNVAGSASSSAGTMKKVTESALKEMQKQYQEYAKEVQRLNDDISSRSRNLYAELRALARTGMTDSSAWADQKKEAEQYMEAAKKAAQEAQSAMSAGDQITATQKWKEAVQYADDAKSAYKDLNKEVKDGDTVVVSQQQALRTSFDGVKQAGELAIGILKQQKDATKDAMSALEGKASFDELTKGMSEAEKTWLKSWEDMSKYTMDQIHQIDLALDDVANKKRTAKLVVDYVDGSRNVYTSGDGMGFSLGGLIQRLADGGTVRNVLAGAFLPGFGGGDRRLLLGEDGEVMLNKHAVRAGGLKTALAFNAGRWDIVLEELTKKVQSGIGFHLGGLVGGLPALPIQHLATGGAVSGGAVSGGADFGTVNLAFPSGSTIPVRTDKETARAMLREFERMGWRASS